MRCMRDVLSAHWDAGGIDHPFHAFRIQQFVWTQQRPRQGGVVPKEGYGHGCREVVVRENPTRSTRYPIGYPVLLFYLQRPRVTLAREWLPTLFGTSFMPPCCYYAMNGTAPSNFAISTTITTMLASFVSLPHAET